MTESIDHWALKVGFWAKKTKTFGVPFGIDFLIFSKMAKL